MWLLGSRIRRLALSEAPKIRSFFFLIFFSSLAFNTFALSSPWPMSLGLGLGPAWLNQSTNAQSVTLNPDVTKSFAPSASSTTQGLGELWLTWEIPYQWVIKNDVGFVFQGLNQAHLTGFIWEDSNPQYANTSYQINANLARAAVLWRVNRDLLIDRYLLEPYAELSLGVAWNQTKDYRVNNLICSGQEFAMFAGQSQTSWSYALGLGLQAPVTSRISVGMAYEWIQWGSISLAAIPEWSMNSVPKLSALSTNALLLTVSAKI